MSFWKRHIRHIMNWWPPFAGAGIRITRISPDWRSIDVEMKLRFWNANYVGTHYGGSLYSMTDPFYMLMLIENLGREYIVWDKSASIRFRKPGRGKVSANFRLLDSEIEAIRDALKNSDKVEPTFLIEVKNEAGELIADVEKVLQVRNKGVPSNSAIPT